MNWQSIIVAILTSGVVTAILNFYFENARENKKLALQKNFHGFQDRLITYRMVVDILADFLYDLAIFFESGGHITPDKIKTFDRLRMKTYGYLALLAPQDVMDAHERLVEEVLNILEGKKQFSWPEIREKCLEMLNAARSDLGVDSSPISYNGNR